MRSTYQFLAYAIAVLVVVQAGAIAWAFFGLTNWIDQNNGWSSTRPASSATRLRAVGSPPSGASPSTCSSTGSLLIPLRR